MTGRLEKAWGGAYHVLCSEGYISAKGGFCKKMRDAMRFRGAGYAIRYAQIHGIAITEW